MVRGDVNRIRIGAGTNVQDGTVIHVNHDPNGSYLETGGGMPTYIGDDVTIGHMALIHACTIESGGFVGMNATIMDEAVVERRRHGRRGRAADPAQARARGELGAAARPRRCAS